MLGLGDCKHIFAGSLPAGFLLPMEDSEEQKVGGREQFLASGSDGVMITGNCDNVSGDQSAALEKSRKAWFTVIGSF